MLHFFWVGWWVVGVCGVCVGVWGGGGGTTAGTICGISR